MDDTTALQLVMPPPEILESILSYITDFETLSAMSLVHPYWTYRTRRHLFASLNLAKNIPLFFEILTSPMSIGHLQGCFKVLNVAWGNKFLDEWNRARADHADPALLDAEYTTLFSSVHSLTVNVNGKMHRSLASTLRANFRHVTVLKLMYLALPRLKDLTGILAFMDHVEYLTISGYWLDSFFPNENHEDDGVFPISPRLQALHLECRNSDIMSWFLALNRIPRLNMLHLDRIVGAEEHVMDVFFQVMGTDLKVLRLSFSKSGSDVMIRRAQEQIKLNAPPEFDVHPVLEYNTELHTLHIETAYSTYAVSAQMAVVHATLLQIGSLNKIKNIGITFHVQSASPESMFNNEVDDQDMSEWIKVDWVLTSGMFASLDTVVIFVICETPGSSVVWASVPSPTVISSEESMEIVRQAVLKRLPICAERGINFRVSGDDGEARTVDVRL